jgi:hypothetical protein
VTCSFDHLVGTHEEHWWDCRSECTCCLRVDSQLELGWSLDRQVGPAFAPRRNLSTRLTILIKIGTKVASHGRYVMFQMAEVAVPRQMFRDNLRLIARLRALPAPA